LFLCVALFVSLSYDAPIIHNKGATMGMGVYKIINVVNNKFYVGSAVNFSRRKSRHFSELRAGKHNNRMLQSAWNKYGEQSFVFVVVEEVADKTILLSTENKWLKDHVGKEYCYNIGVDAMAPMLGMSGESSPTWGYKHTKASLQKIGNASKARVQSEEEKAKRRQTMRGHAVPTEVRAKISAKLAGEGNYWYGKKRPDHGAKVSRAVVAIQPNGVRQEYASIALLREDLGLKPPTINRAVKSNKALTRGPFTGWVFKYLDTPQKEA
jgi:group I intron endonuclease